MVAGERTPAAAGGSLGYRQSEGQASLESGLFLVDKPPGPTSFRMVSQIRRILQVKKVGHAGTLDPFASGLLIICAGRPATRIISRLMAGEKEYVATLQLGIETTTQDPEGEVISRQPVPPFEAAEIDRCLENFRGELLQTPPQFSALKHEGKPLYYYARQGITVTKEPRRVVISELERLSHDGDRLTVRVVCSKGTYIRTLAADIGRALGCGAFLTALRRLRSGPFRVEEAIDGALLPDLGKGEGMALRRGHLSLEAALSRLGEPS